MILGALDVCGTPTGCAAQDETKVTQDKDAEAGGASAGLARIVIFGDSGCLDESGAVGATLCLKLLKAIVEYAVHADKTDLDVFPRSTKIGKEDDQYNSLLPLPVRRGNSELYKYSKVLAPGAMVGGTCDWQHKRTRAF
mmetsp:Transcript_61545/g.84615  ORF Transcript_61545/g.84615 Transcript_61545/m.84615 type:complete len:139 (+) Transcript_61545:442-858(+)